MISFAQTGPRHSFLGGPVSEYTLGVQRLQFTYYTELISLSSPQPTGYGRGLISDGVEGVDVGNTSDNLLLSSRWVRFDHGTLLHGSRSHSGAVGGIHRDGRGAAVIARRVSQPSPSIGSCTNRRHSRSYNSDATTTAATRGIANKPGGEFNGGGRTAAGKLFERASVEFGTTSPYCYRPLGVHTQHFADGRTSKGNGRSTGGWSW